MKKASTTTSSSKRLKISTKTRLAYRKRDRALDADPDAPQLPPAYWADAVIGKYYRPRKTQVSVRIDDEVLDWLKNTVRLQDDHKRGLVIHSHNQYYSSFDELFPKPGQQPCARRASVRHGLESREGFRRNDKEGLRGIEIA